MQPLLILVSHMVVYAAVLLMLVLRTNAYR